MSAKKHFDLSGFVYSDEDLEDRPYRGCKQEEAPAEEQPPRTEEDDDGGAEPQP